jgi:hypothetical protein
MIAMLDTSDDLAVCEREIGCPVEQLLTPLTRYRRKGEGMFGIDNGAFSGFREKEFRALLKRELPARSKCRFVTVPDVVASARRTLEVFEHWRHELAGWPIALVAQDGLEDMTIPWGFIDAIFIGGSTEWKMGQHAEHCIRAAKIMNKWVHVGRINTPERYAHFEKLGADSFDGSGIAQYSWMRERIRKSLTEQKAPTLFDEEAIDVDGEVVLPSAVGLVRADAVLDSDRTNAEG